MIMHIDMDAFFASIEQAINPRLKGRPLIVGSRPNKMHTVVCAASYEAKALGISSGMPSKEAFRLCPDLAFVPADQSRYIWTSEQIFALLKDYGFILNYASIDEFQLDIGSLTQRQILVQEIQSRIRQSFQITASIGIAKNWLLAKLASKINKPNGIAIITDKNQEEILAKVAVNKLCGVGEKTSLIMDALGIKTCLDLYQKTAWFLREHLGQAGLDLYAGLRQVGHLEPESSRPEVKSIGHSYTLPRASANPGFIHAWLSLLAEMVARRLRQKNLLSQTVHLWLNGPQIGNFSAQKTFQQATSDPYEIFQRGLKIMAFLGPGIPKIRALGITCSKLSQAKYLPLLKEQKQREELISALDQINSRYGENTIHPALIKLTQKIPQ